VISKAVRVDMKCVRSREKEKFEVVRGPIREGSTSPLFGLDEVLSAAGLALRPVPRVRGK